ncbi:MAG: hypothetical protein ACFB9M_05995 [Myxococcota bacterium]
MRAVVLGSIAGLLLGACATTSTQERLDELRSSVESYIEAFRWKYYERAAAFLPNDSRTEFLTTFEEHTTSLHVEEIKILEVDVESDDSAEITVRYRYLLMPSVTVRSKVVKQSWHRVDGDWLLEHEDPPLVALRDEPKPKLEREEDAFGGDLRPFQGVPRSDPSSTDATNGHDDPWKPPDGGEGND